MNIKQSFSSESRPDLKANAVLNDKAAPQRNSNIIEIAAQGQTAWQKAGNVLDRYWIMVKQGDSECSRFHRDIVNRPPSGERRK